MSADRYTVVQRNGQWWVMLDAERRGPFNSRDEAIESAVQGAKINERQGRKAEIAWDDPDDGAPIVYKSED